MDVLDILTNTLRCCGRVIKLGADIQEPARAGLVSDLQGICSNAEDSFGKVLARLLPIKSASNEPKTMASELHKFRADQETRQAFKPEHLCRRVDQILMDLASNLSALRYSLDVGRLDQIRHDLGGVGTLDDGIYRSYDDLTARLDKLAFDIEEHIREGRPKEAGDATRGALQAVLVFEDELRTAIADMHSVKDRILRG